MQEDSEGFSYPVVDVSVCIRCGLCEKVCPELNRAEAKRPLEVYAAINPDEEIRRISSSGGIFTLLAEQVIADGGVVFGAKFNEAWEVVHGYSETSDGIGAFRGSKYVQSTMGESFRQAEDFLKAGRKVLFTGTSCQIAGLRRFLGRDYDELLTADVICHGVPSPSVWREYVEAIKTRPQGVVGKNTVLSFLNAKPVITGIAFRDKSTGWKKYGFVVSGHADLKEAYENSVLLSAGNDRIIFQEIHYENLFMKGFLENIYLRPSCYTCPAKTGRAGSDITLGDYWGIERQHPDMDDDRGTSLVAVHTEKGRQAFCRLNCKSKLSSYEQGLAGNPSIEQSVEMPRIRSKFYRKFAKTQNINAIQSALDTLRPSLIVRIKFRIRQIIKRLK